jgi:ABC-type branched-subunit amino acid transport system substrate-binding protein
MTPDQVSTFYDLLDSIPKEQRPTKIGHMELQVDWGKECGDYIREMAKKRGYAIVADLKYAPPTKDFSSIILDLKSAGAELFFRSNAPRASSSSSR